MNSAFLDTNILVYSFDSTTPDKQRIALSTIERANDTGQLTVSTQVILEFVSAATRKLQVPLSHDEVVKAINDFRGLTIVQISADLIMRAVHRTNSMSISIWDALIVEAALHANCEVLLTEDLNHGQVIDGQLRIVNPFVAETAATNP